MPIYKAPLKETRFLLHDVFNYEREVASLPGLSAHADAGEILQWLRGFAAPPTQTFVTHGEPAAADAMRLRIEHELGWPCRVPDYLETVDLS